MLQLKGYKIDKLIYEGKDTIIYRAYSKWRKKNVLLKTVSSEKVTLKNVDKLKKEYEISKKINFVKGILQTYELETWEGRPVLIKEYFEGTSLRNFIKTRRINIQQFLKIAIQLTDILNEIHKKKIIHLDINPNNILINDDEKTKIIDFNSSMIMEKDNQREEDCDQLEGTLEYVSPEQTGRIGKAIDYRSDYYSLGICFYQLLTGKLPFNNSDRLELIYAHIAKKAVAPVELDNDIPEVLSNITMKLISKMPQDRYQSLSGLKRDLVKCQESLDANGTVEDFEIAQQDINDRFEISSKLYGREAELNELIKHANNAVDGGKELVLVKGYSGVGKTALVNRMHNKLLGNQLYFISGKFDQFQSQTPYNAIIQALEKFINELLMQSAEELKVWKEKIVEAIGKNGQLLTHVLPSLELIIGKQEKVPELGPKEAQNRFNLVIENFMKVIAQKEHPLIMFIDDLQWIDIASLNLIKMLILNNSIQNLLIIGAYRDNEVGLEHPVALMEKELIQNKSNVNIVKVEALGKQQVQKLLEDTLTTLTEDNSIFEELSDFIYSKTAGNCFFMKEFLQVLYDKKYIWFDYSSMQWCWDTEQIKKMDITQNVVDLLIQKINTLDVSIVEDLKNAACIGNIFDLKTLKLVTNKSSQIVSENLQVAVEKGLICSIKNKDVDENTKDNINFRFLHDRIQQAVYKLIPEDEKLIIHLNIGKLLLKEYLNSKKTEQLFEVVKQLNTCKSIINDEVEIINLAELNLKAAMASKKSSAYKTSFLYLQVAIDLLNDNCWEKYYDLSLKLYSEITEMAYLTGDFEKMDKYGEKVVDNAKTVIDKTSVYNVKLQAYQAQLKIREALGVTTSALKEMGVDLPLQPTQEDISNAFQDVQRIMADIQVEDLVDLPLMEDPLKLATMQILLGSISVTAKAAPMLTPIVVCKMMEYSLKYGNAPCSVVSYVSYAMSLCALDIDLNLAYKLGKMSCTLVKNQNLSQYKAMVLNIYGSVIQCCGEDLRSTINIHKDVYNSGMENGDLEYAGYGVVSYCEKSVYIGRKLEEIEKDIKSGIEKLKRIKQGTSLGFTRIYGQLVLNMQGKCNDTTKLIGEICDENKMIDTIKNNNDMVTETYLFLNKMILNYYFQKYDSSIECSEKLDKNIRSFSGLFEKSMYAFFDSLSRLAVYINVSDKEKQNILTRVSQNQTMMKKMADHAPMNFLHKFYLVEAEHFRILGKTDEAIDMYNKAISAAKESQYINDEALANELATKFWLDKNNYRYAKLHFKEAYYCYKHWGAEAKVKDLQNKYLQIFHEKFEGYMNESQTTILELIDIATIMKASQAISQEIVLDKLIKTLIKIVIENLGAQKVVFIVNEENNLIIKGEKESEQEKITVGLDKKVEEYKNIPKSIVNYVSRTMKSVILENSIESVSFGGDKYIITNKPKSVLCYPLINQGEFKGIIYVENNLIKGAFTKDRLKVLEILSAQIVIALENAKLYEKLELSNLVLDNKVRERTLELKEQRDKLKKYLDIAEVSISVLDKNGNFVSLNRKGYQILGYSEEEVLENHWSKFVSTAESKDEDSKVKTLINGETVRYIEVVVTTKTGEERMISCYNVTLKDKDGNTEGILSCGVDVTEYNLLREQLEYNKLKLEFLANLSHELKTPLNLSFCALQMLNLYLNDNINEETNKKFEKYTKVIKQNNYRLLKLVNNIVDITRINSNSFELNLKNNDIVDLTKNITSSVSDYVKNKSRVLQFNSNIESKIIRCDAFIIERVMLNLLSNAIKFTNEGDEISVNIYDKDDTVTIVVRDTGIGVPKNKQNIIFERFRQVDKSFTRNSEGSGIGLTIVKLLVELHHGDIRVESKEGEYSEFIIDLPVRKLCDAEVAADTYNDYEDNLIDRIDIEFSDVYGLL